MTTWDEKSTACGFSEFASLMLWDYQWAKGQYPDNTEIHRGFLGHFVENASKARWPRDVIAAHLPVGCSLGSEIDCLQGKINYPNTPPAWFPPVTPTLATDSWIIKLDAISKGFWPMDRDAP